MTTVTIADIDRAYSAGPIDWNAVSQRIREMYAYDGNNAVTIDADVAMILRSSAACGKRRCGRE